MRFLQLHLHVLAPITKQEPALKNFHMKRGAGPRKTHKRGGGSGGNQMFWASMPMPGCCTLAQRQQSPNGRDR